MRPRLRVTSLVAVLAVLAAATLAIAACGDDSTSPTTSASPSAKASVKIGITQIVSHPALDACVVGFKKGMAEKGYTEGTNVTYDVQNAQGEMATASSIAQKFAGQNLDLILGIATPTTQAMVKADKETPIVFTAVTDPVGAGLVKNAETPEANVTGVSDMLPLQPHLDLIKQIVPDVKTIGVLYNAGETNSVFLVEEQKKLAEAMGIEVIEATASNSSEVQAAANSLKGRVDAISVLTDNTIVSALETVIKVCQDAEIPLICGDTDSVERGAVAAYAFDYEDLGLQAGYMAADILAGKAIGEIPVQYAENLQLSINPTAAAAMGVTIPDAVKAEADQTFGE